jgi:hypothetical protein
MAKLWDAFKVGWNAPVDRSELGQPKGVFKCRWCRKRLKVGARVCHHCGREQFPVEGMSPATSTGQDAAPRDAAGGDVKARRAEIEATLETLGYRGRALIEGRLRVVKAVVSEGRTVDEALDDEMIRAAGNDAGDS